MDALDRLELQDHEQLEPMCCCHERAGDNPDCPLHHPKPDHTPETEMVF